MIGINQIILTPCILLHTNFNIPFYLSIIVNILILTYSFFIPKIKYDRIENRTITVFTIVIVLMQLFFVTIFYKSNADDSFYVSLSESSISNIEIYKEEPSIGYKSEDILLAPTEQIPTIELQIAIFSKIANVNSAVMCHFILPMIIVFIAYLSFYYFGRSFMDDKNAKIFLIVLSIILLFAGFSTKFRTGCLLIKPWQGKAIFLSIGIPVALANLISIDKELKKKNIILLAVTNLFSLALSSTAIFLVPFMYLPFGILKLIKGKWKDILLMVVSFIPIIIYVLVYISINQYVETPYSVPRDDVSIKQSIEYFNSNIYLLYYCISTIIILFLGNRQAKRYFGLIQLINLLTIWNPLLSNIIAKYFTSSAIFWRVLWIMPIEYAIAYAVVLVLEKTNKNEIKIFLFNILISILIITGKFTYSSFKVIENLENIPQPILEQTNYILENGKDDEQIVVLALPEPNHNTMMRQVSSKIKLIYSRNLYIDKIRNKEEIEIRKNLNQMYFGNYIYGIEDFNEILKQLKIDWVIVDENDTNLISYIEESILKKDKKIQNCLLFKNNGNK